MMKQLVKLRNNFVMNLQKMERRASLNSSLALPDEGDWAQKGTETPVSPRVTNIVDMHRV